MKKLLVLFAVAFTVPALRAQELSVSTNLLDYADFATLNMEASFGVARHWSISALARYNPFTFGSGDGTILQRQQSYALGTRWWPWHVFSGWWLSGKVQYQEFNEGGIQSRRTSQGDRFGTSLSAGYTYMLTRHLNLELGLGFWGGYEIYTVYSCQHCGSVVDGGEKFFLLPDDMTLGLSFVF